MATATKIKLVEFNRADALNGATLAFSSNGELDGDVSAYILNFQLNDIGSTTEKYSGQVLNKKYYFNDNGICSDNDPLHTLFVVDAEIIPTKGTSASRGDGETQETTDIDVLQPRECFAMYALQGILTKTEDPLTLNDAQITLISNMAFKIAQSMMSTAADYRAATQSEDTPPPSVNVDINNVTSTTDKLLYNMSQSMVDMQNSLKGIKDTMSGQEGEIQKVELSAVSVTEIPVRVVNSSINTYVDNMVSEPVIVTGTVDIGNTVNVTGTVSVDNFPSSEGGGS